jgi:hypothetical protein
MLIICLKKTGSLKCGNSKPYKKISGNGLNDDIYKMACTPNIKPSEVLRNISIKKSITPKRYITFE